MYRYYYDILWDILLIDRRRLLVVVLQDTRRPRLPHCGRASKLRARGTGPRAREWSGQPALTAKPPPAAAHTRTYTAYAHEYE